MKSYIYIFNALLCLSITSHAQTPGVDITIGVNPRGTYLRVDEQDQKDPPTKFNFNLDEYGYPGKKVVPGDILAIEGSGVFYNGVSYIDNNMIAVLIDDNGQYLYPDSGSNVVAVYTLPTWANHYPTDIPQDFNIIYGQTNLVVVPEGATSILFSPNDQVYGDNSDPNGEYTAHIRIKVLKEIRLDEFNLIQSVKNPDVSITDIVQNYSKDYIFNIFSKYYDANIPRSEPVTLVTNKPAVFELKGSLGSFRAGEIIPLKIYLTNYDNGSIETIEDSIVIETDNQFEFSKYIEYKTTFEGHFQAKAVINEDDTFFEANKNDNFLFRRHDSLDIQPLTLGLTNVTCGLDCYKTVAISDITLFKNPQEITYINSMLPLAPGDFNILTPPLFTYFSSTNTQLIVTTGKGKKYQLSKGVLEDFQDLEKIRHLSGLDRIGGIFNKDYVYYHNETTESSGPPQAFSDLLGLTPFMYPQVFVSINNSTVITHEIFHSLLQRLERRINDPLIEFEDNHFDYFSKQMINLGPNHGIMNDDSVSMELTDRWVEKNTYEKALVSLRFNDIDPEIFFIRGILDKDGTLEDFSVETLSHGQLRYNELDGDLLIQGLDFSGQVVTSLQVQASFYYNIEGDIESPVELSKIPLALPLLKDNNVTSFNIIYRGRSIGLYPYHNESIDFERVFRTLKLDSIVENFQMNRGNVFSKVKVHYNMYKKMIKKGNNQLARENLIKLRFLVKNYFNDVVFFSGNNVLRQTLLSSIDRKVERLTREL